MSEVRIIYRGVLAETVGKREDSVDAVDVKDVISHIQKNYGRKTAGMARTMVIAVNGTNILKREVYKTKLEEGDEVCFLPIAGGG